MTRNDLEKVYYLKRELKMWQRRYDELIADMSQDTVAADGLPHSVTNSIGRPTENKAVLLADHVELIREHMQKINLAIRDVESFIATIDDPLTRQIIENRCVKCMSWKEVADECDDGTTADCVRQAYHRFLKEIHFE
ncbi:MAG: hypothetical protein IKT37_07695 [Clostridia bacterium]|nr:hypothetical protein [Clostridia bacterium]